MLLNPLFIYVVYQKFAVVSANGNMMDVGTAITIGRNRRGFRDRGTSALNGAGTGLLGLEKCMAPIYFVGCLSSFWFVQRSWQIFSQLIS